MTEKCLLFDLSKIFKAFQNLTYVFNGASQIL